MSAAPATPASRFERLWNLRNELINDHGVDEKLADAVLTSIQRIEDRDEDIQNQGARLIDRIQRTMDSVARGEHINELGELQGAAPSFDIACARRQDAVEATARLIWVLLGDEAKAAARLVAFGTAE